MITVDITKDLNTFKLESKFTQENGILGFLGQSGSGKSMSLRCIAGLEKPTNGKIILNDTVLFDSEKKINLPPQKRNVGFLFQNYALFPNMTIYDNIAIGISNTDTAKKKILISDYLERFSINGIEKKYPWQLSGGQQQRVALARALITSPDILLLDEPFSALDYHLRLNMEKELKLLLKSYKGDVIFVTHDINEAYRLCDNIIVYDNGKTLKNREKSSLFDSPKSLAEATLTGCKNISGAKKIDDNTIFATDWHLEYKVLGNVADNITNIAIRAHLIKIFKSSETGENIYPFLVTNIIENPFDFNIYIKNSKKENSGIINFTVNKEEMDFSIGDTINVCFPKQNLFYF